MRIFLIAIALFFVLPELLFPQQSTEEENWFREQNQRNRIVRTASTDTGFYRGRILFEVGGGAGLAKISSSAVLRSRNESYSDYHILLYSNNPTRRAVSLAKVTGAKKPDTLERNGRIAVEYALFDYLGLGLSYSRSKIRTRNLRVDPLEENDPYFLLQLGSGYTNPSDINADPGFHDLIDLQRRDIAYRDIQGLDFELGIHPVRGAFDPYVKMAFGLNILKSGLDYKRGGGAIISRNRSRFGLLAGVRIFATSRLFFGMELYTYDYADNNLKRKIDTSLHRENGVRLQLGTAL